MIEGQPDLQCLTRDQDWDFLALLLAHFHAFCSFGDLLSGLLAFNCFKFNDLTCFACTAVEDAADFTDFFSCVSIIASQHPELDSCFTEFMDARCNILLQFVFETCAGKHIQIYLTSICKGRWVYFTPVYGLELLLTQLSHCEDKCA